METTKQDFELFKKSCQKWIDYFGIKDYEVFYKHEKIEDDAQCQWGGFGANNATLTLSTETTDTDIEKCAFHEVCELMLCEMYEEIEKFYSEDYAQKIGHRIIRFLENSIYKQSLNS